MRRLLIAMLLAPLMLAAEENRLPKNGDKIAFLGDSITMAGTRNRFGYLNLVALGLKANGIAITLVPAGVSGNKSPQMLERLESSVLAKQPQMMFLSCGVNDVWHSLRNRGVSLEDYRTNITAIVDRAQASGIKVAIMTASMIQEDPNGDLNRKLVPYNEFLRKLAAEKGCLLVDVNAEMQKAVGAIRKQTPVNGNTITVDGVHMNPLGDMMMARAILRALGLNDAQMAKAEAAWDKVNFIMNDRVRLTVRDYRKLSAKAFAAGKSVPDYVAELILTHLGD